ncbi:MAG: hypothetical protein K2M17_06355, partial [Bacilli bacterium]|nr:hypothetical protein [Bacilli bacterium]
MLSFTLKIGIWTMFLFGLFFVFFILGSWIDFHWLYRLSPDIYHFLGDIYSFFTQSVVIFLLLPLIWLLGVFVLVYQEVKKVYFYLQALSVASTDLMDKSVDYIT